VAYPIRENGVGQSLGVQPLDGSRGRQITYFDSEQILNFPFWSTGRQKPSAYSAVISTLTLSSSENRPHSPGALTSKLPTILGDKNHTTP